MEKDKFLEDLGLIAMIGKATKKKHDAEDVFLDTSRGKSISGALDDQNRREQDRVKKTTELPRRHRKYYNEEAKEKDEEMVKEWYKKLGIEITGIADNLLFSVVLPEGWKLESTSHGMWMNLVDEKGYKRAKFWYDGTFYKRSASISLNTRFSVDSITDYDSHEHLPFYKKRNKQKVYGIALDNEKEIYRSATTSFGEVYPEIPDNNDREACKKWHKKYEEFQQDIFKECIEWLNKRHPNWRDEFAYWEVE